MTSAKTARQPKPETDNVWTAEERAAVQAAASERKSQAGRDQADERAAGEAELTAALAKLPADDRAMAERLHELVSAAAPALVPKTYYGMPGWTTPGKNGRSICFFKPKSKFRVRYSNLGFQPGANLDDGQMWATEFAVTELTPSVEARITELVRKAVG
ncbi:MAG TPA: DUF1801 domain-containing protein [Candidatus Binatus sp.]|nr:DUF1801 domain-containing protein [Candidatus Binatus sp.]